MPSALLIAGSIFVGIAALIHVYIFVLESVQWSRPRTWRTFGLKSQAEADTVKPMAFNQGFYNVFLAIGAGAGLVMLASANLGQGGAVLTFFSAGSMVLAALVLITSSPKLARAALIQGVAPLIGIVLLAIGLATSYASLPLR
jgi:putative membrane protein